MNNRSTYECEDGLDEAAWERAMFGGPDPEPPRIDYVAVHLMELRRLLVQLETRCDAEHFDAAVDDAERVSLEAARLLGAVERWADQ